MRSPTPYSNAIAIEGQRRIVSIELLQYIKAVSWEQSVAGQRKGAEKKEMLSFSAAQLFPLFAAALLIFVGPKQYHIVENEQNILVRLARCQDAKKDYLLHANASLILMVAQSLYPLASSTPSDLRDVGMYRESPRR